MRGVALDLISQDSFVSRGSQFPTQWGQGGRARYLDAILRRGDVPWALEIKVPKSGGAGIYYRHGLAQAVLYRHFIRHATRVHPWFEAQGVNPTTCEAALVYPTTASLAKLRTLKELATLFDVSIIEIDAAV